MRRSSLFLLCVLASAHAGAQPAELPADAQTAEPSPEQIAPVPEPPTKPALAPRHFPEPRATRVPVAAEAMCPAPEAGPLCYEDRGIGIHIALNVGLFAIDYQAKHFYAMVAGNAAVPLLSNGAYFAMTALGGYSIELRRNAKSAWKADFLLHLAPGFSALSGGQSTPFLGAGVVLGFRYEHRGGFSLGIRLPLFGYAMGTPAGFGTGTVGGVLNYYLASAVGLPILSFGYRF